MSEHELQVKIAHLEMIQGVIGRMASDSQMLKTLAITVVAAIIALAQTSGGVTPRLAYMGILPTLLFWWLTAYYLHIERAYRYLYDIVRKDGPVEQFSMDWRQFKGRTSGTLKLMFTPSVSLLYASVIVLLLTIAGFAGGGPDEIKGSNLNDKSIPGQVQ